MTRRNIFSITLLSIVAISANTLIAEEQKSWPRKIEKGSSTVVIYQPQIESLTANKMEARAAVSLVTEEYTSPVFGAMWFDCNLSTDRDERTVRLLEMEVSAAKFPNISEEEIEKLSTFLEKEVPGWAIDMSLDELLSDLDMNETSVELSSNLNNAPPEIIFKTSPSMLILVDGDLIFEQIEKTKYERVVNTPFFIVKDTKKANYYINGGDNWYVSENAADWKPTTKVPSKLEKIAEEAITEPESEEAATQEGREGEQEGGEEEGEPAIPAIILRTTPAELLQSDGEPEFSPIEGTSILYMTNTADDILMNIETQEYYILVAGRWYKSTSMTDGPWAFVEPEEIPEGFSTIPADSDMGSVRSSVAGTQEAKEAVLENQIPQTAEVDRNEAKLEVTYDGKPKFEKVKDTEMQYAINTDKSVLLIDSRYYCCDNAIWFESDAPTGPWIVSVVIPETVQEIPPESPVYNVKYVYIYDSTPSVVYVGYTPGYVHSYAYGGCVYYGTGYYYNPWYGVHYYPRPVTYGYSVHYNPYTGWGFSFGVSYGWMTFGWGSPRYGYWGPAGYRHGYHYGYRHGYHRGYRSGYRAGYYAGQRNSYPRTQPYPSHRTASNNVYSNRSQGIRRTGNNYYDPRTGTRDTSPDRASRPSTQPANRPNDVYTDRDGNVYRKDGDNWNKLDNGSRPDSRPSTGQPSTRPSQPSTGQPSTRPSQPSVAQPSTRPGSSGSGNLNRDYNSRNRGAERSQQYNRNRQNYQYSRPPSSGSSRPSASPSRSGGSRPSSGGSRRR